ncbi:MAG: histidine phosphatase family protein [Bacilli bacterium]|nr:histidine phosphatase family protein [Bacilli bacterium]
MKLIYLHHSERDMTSNKKWGTIERTFDDITIEGINRANFLAEKLKGQKITAIITSPYLRCKHTAQIINKYQNLNIIEDDRFNEIQKGEKWEDLLKRNIKAIDDIVKKYPDDSVIICVTSGLNISAFICYTYNITPSNDVPLSQAADLSPVIFNINKTKETNQVFDTWC